MIARDEGWVAGAHQLGGRFFARKPGAPSLCPGIKYRRVCELRARRPRIACRRIRQRAERQGEISALFRHAAQQILDQRGIFWRVRRYADLPRKAIEISGFKGRGEGAKGRLRKLQRGFFLFCQKGQKRFRKPRQIPLRHAWLIGIGIAPAVINGTQDRRGIIGIHEGAGAVINRLTADGHIVGIHHAMDEADMEPLRDQPRLTRDHARQQRDIGVFRAGRRRIMPRNGKIREQLQRFLIFLRGEILKAADTDMAGRHARQHRARLRFFAQHCFACHRHRQRARGRHAKRCHGFADDGFAQHRPQHGAAISAARKQCASAALQMNISALPIAPNHLTY